MMYSQTHVYIEGDVCSAFRDVCVDGSDEINKAFLFEYHFNLFCC